MFAKLRQWGRRPWIWIRDWLTYHSFGLTFAVLILAFFLVYFAPRIFISIHSGQAGVRWKRFSGTMTAASDVYFEGLHVILPVDIMYIYNLRYQILTRRVSALTRGGLEIQADMGLMYRVRKDHVGALHQQVGPKYIETLIVPTLDAAARNILSALDAETMYAQHSVNVGETDLFERSLFERAKDDIGRHYIEVADLSIMRLILPERVQQVVQQKHQEEQMVLLYDFRIERERKEVERKRIEAQGIKAFQDILGARLSENYLKFKGIEATLELAKSANSKVVVMGNGSGLPLILSTPAGDTGNAGGVVVPPLAEATVQELQKRDPSILKNFEYQVDESRGLGSVPRTQ